MAGAGPLAPAEAERSGTAERYVGEWLKAQVAGGYVAYHPESGRFSLPAEAAPCSPTTAAAGWSPGSRPCCWPWPGTTRWSRRASAAAAGSAGTSARPSTGTAPTTPPARSSAPTCRPGWPPWTAWTTPASRFWGFDYHDASIARARRLLPAGWRLGHARGRYGALSLSRRTAAALVAGRLDEADMVSREAAHVGQEIGEVDAAAVLENQQWELARFRDGGRAGNWNAVAGVGFNWPAYDAVVLAEAGDRGAAEAALAGLDLDAFVLRPGVRSSNDPWPLAGTHVVVAGFVAHAGAVDHYPGRLAAAPPPRRRHRAGPQGRHRPGSATPSPGSAASTPPWAAT